MDRLLHNPDNQMSNNPKWRPVDWIVAMLTLTICTVVVMACASPLIRGEELGETQVKALASVITASVSIVSMYVGAKLQKHADSAK